MMMQLCPTETILPLLPASRGTACMQQALERAGHGAALARSACSGSFLQ